MQFSAIIVTLMASLAIATPANMIDIRGGGGGKTVTITTTGAGGKTVTVTTTTTTSSVSTATGSTGSGGTYNACTGSVLVDSIMQCCATDVLGVADLNCAAPATAPSSAANFKSICASSGQQATCCTLPLLGQALICEKPSGV